MLLYACIYMLFYPSSILCTIPCPSSISCTMLHSSSACSACSVLGGFPPAFLLPLSLRSRVTDTRFNTCLSLSLMVDYPCLHVVRLVVMLACMLRTRALGQAGSGRMETDKAGRSHRPDQPEPGACVYPHMRIARYVMARRSPCLPRPAMPQPHARTGPARRHQSHGERLGACPAGQGRAGPPRALE